MKTILVIEDEPDVRKNLIELLNAEGFNVISAKDGQEGFEMAVSNEPDLILSDIRMPRMDGFELLEKLQENSTTAIIPFIFLTAKAEMKDLRRGMIIGADDYIIKPFRIVDVLDAVNSRLKKKDNYLSVIDEFKHLVMKRVPHELRTPLVGILGFSNIILDDLDNLPKDEIKLIAERILSSGKRLHRRIEKFLTYTQLLHQSQNKEHGMNSKEYDLKPELLSQTLSQTAIENGRKEDLLIELQPGKLKISYYQFETMLTELIENSFKFSQKGTFINLTGKNSADFYCVNISDEGIRTGKITYEDIKSFNQFGKEDFTEEGLGMGLAIVKKIIELNDGYISFESTEMKDNFIEIKIPLKIELV